MMPGSLPANVPLEPRARIRELSENAASVTIYDVIPARRYFRSGHEMKRMADIYFEENELEKAFMLYSKFITLFVEKLPKHLEYKDSTQQERGDIKRKVKEVFPKAERIKQLLLKQYEQEYSQWQKFKEEEETRLAKEREVRQRQMQEQQELERSRSDIEKQARLTQQKERQKSTVADDYVIPPSAPVISDWPSLIDWESGSASEMKEVPNDMKPLGPIPPVSDVIITDRPTIDRSTKPNSLCGVGKNLKGGLRNVIVPLRMMGEFLKLAESNTVQGIETCGVLAGKLCQDVFTITHLVVPQQCGTTDSCTTKNEEELFLYVDQYSLLTLGWIHTHPTQTSFLSSVDLHMHCSYQMLMPEAIAIVCAPKYEETGVYMLTLDYGLDFIRNCQQVGFHPHPKEPPLFETCQHVIMDDRASVVIKDMRDDV